MRDIGDGANYAPSCEVLPVVRPGEFCFAAAHLDHGHIFGQTNGLRDAGATLKWVYEPDPVKRRKFTKTYPDVRVACCLERILEDPEVRLVAAAAVPNERAALGCRVMQAGKDYFTDKAPFTTLDQLEQTRANVERTGQKYAVYYAERLHNDAAWYAGELIARGAIGCVLQVLALAPHRLAANTRPEWFFDKRYSGGILTDIGSHQVEQFLTYASCRDARINFARVDNFCHSARPSFEDFGEISLTGDNGASFYTRVDWFTPAGQRAWGDGRIFILGSEGSIELRKYLDVARQAPSSKLFLVNGKGEQEIECLGQTGFPYFRQLLFDCINRTEIAMTQSHAFKVAELTMLAQAFADRVRSAEQSTVHCPPSQNDVDSLRR